MEMLFLIVLLVLIITVIILLVVFRPKENSKINLVQDNIEEVKLTVIRLQNEIKDEFRFSREENSNSAKDNRTELNNTLKDFRNELALTLKNITEQSQTALKEINSTLSEKVDSLIKKIDENNKVNRDSLSSGLKEFSVEQRTKFDELKNEQQDSVNKTFEQLEKIIEKLEEKLNQISDQAKNDGIQMRDSLDKIFKSFEGTFDKNVKSFNDLQKEKFSQLENKQNDLIKNTESKLETIRVTVEEILEKTLSDRLGQSFETVGKQLIEVQKGLGEMQSLAQDVGGLKRVLSNVKMRGGIGEVQLGMLLEQILAPEQYEANVKTKLGSNDSVEFAIKLPGRDENNSQVWLPVDAKFPKDIYEQLQTAYEIGDLVKIELAQKNLDSTIKKMAKDISEKYIDPPNTTDFGIMFLPFEGIYAEVVRKASLLDDLQRNFKIIVTGPTTLAAILNSLQMGFKTLAIQKRSSEVWKVLGAVKKEFENFSGLIDKAQKNIQTGLDQLDDVSGKRTKAIQRKLRGVEALDEKQAKMILEDVNDNEFSEEDNEN